MKTMVVDWTALPTDAIEAISTRVSNDADYTRFRSVCTSWRSAAPMRYPQLPWLVVVHPTGLDNDYEDEDEDDDDDDDDVFFELCNFPNTTDFLRPPRLPDQGIIRDKLICGSSRGWIAILDYAPGVTLHNPFTKLNFRLPLLTDLPSANSGFAIGNDIRDKRIPLKSFGMFLANKVVLSSDPAATSSDDCVVMALFYHGERLIYCRPGDTSWTPLSPAFRLNFFQDIIFYKGRFYAVSRYRVFVCDTGPAAKANEILPANPLFSDGQAREFQKGLQSYLVVSSGNLLLTAIQNAYRNGHFVYSCEVFRVDLDDGQLRLVKMENLGGRALFLGSISMSLSTESSASCKGNCIYYMTTKEIHANNEGTIFEEYDSICIFDMEDGSTSSITSLSDQFSGLHWLTPSLC